MRSLLRNCLLNKGYFSLIVVQKILTWSCTECTASSIWWWHLAGVRCTRSSEIVSAFEYTFRCSGALRIFPGSELPIRAVPILSLLCSSTHVLFHQFDIYLARLCWLLHLRFPWMLICDYSLSVCAVIVHSNCSLYEPTRIASSWWVRIEQCWLSTWTNWWWKSVVFMRKWSGNFWVDRFVCRYRVILVSFLSIRLLLFLVLLINNWTN